MEFISSRFSVAKLKGLFELSEVLESVGKAKFGMRRYGDLSAPMNVWV